MSKFITKLQTEKDGCHICCSWTALIGCKHYGPQDFDLNKSIIDAVVKAVHHDSKIDIIETHDFYAGINATLLFLRQSEMLK